MSIMNQENPLTLEKCEQVKGDRFNEGKPKWSLLDFDSFEDMTKVLEMGAEKYGKDNWKKGLPVNEVAESLLRHVFAILRGEREDSESKLPHSAHVLCNAMFIAFMEKNKPEMCIDNEIDL